MSCEMFDCLPSTLQSLSQLSLKRSVWSGELISWLSMYLLLEISNWVQFEGTSANECECNSRCTLDYKLLIKLLFQMALPLSGTSAFAVEVCRHEYKHPTDTHASVVSASLSSISRSLHAFTLPQNDMMHCCLMLLPSRLSLIRK